MTRSISLEVITNSALAEPPMADSAHYNRDPAQWHQAMGVARQACARIFRDGGTPADALRTFGLGEPAGGAANWARAVAIIAESLCTPRVKRAA